MCCRFAATSLVELTSNFLNRFASIFHPSVSTLLVDYYIIFRFIDGNCASVDVVNGDNSVVRL